MENNNFLSIKNDLIYTAECALCKALDHQPYSCMFPYKRKKSKDLLIILQNGV